MTMLEILLRGIGFGVAVAAPVGPIGLLCIRRTLAEGRATGLATGLGAAAADASYGVLVAAGVAATGMLLRHADAMALGGGLLIAVIGLMTMRSFWAGPPAVAPVGAGTRPSGLVAAWATTYVLTLSNPMTILTFVGMVAALGAAASGDPAAPYWLVLGVFLGSALWWLVLVHLALTVKGRMTDGALRWLDLAAGLALLVWGGWIAVDALRALTGAG